jgi:urea transport system substrate-binding protein
MGDLAIVRPQKLRGLALTEFCVAYLKMSGQADRLGNDVESYVRQFKQLLGPQQEAQETVVYFARLFLDYVLERALQDTARADGHTAHRQPQSIPELVESFVDTTCRHAATRHNLPLLKVVGLVRSAARLAISDRQRPALLTLVTLAEKTGSLKAELGIPQDVNLEQVLVDSGLIDRPSPHYLRFKIDLVHEYCAVLHVRDRAVLCTTRQDAYDLWKAWVDEIVAGTDAQPQSSGLLRAIYECLRSDRVAATVPEDLLTLVAHHLGVPSTTLQPIRIGILHSLQGTMAMSELPLRDAALLAVNEINEQGGIGGRRLDAIVRDGESNPDVFAREARRLVRDDGVSSIFGCWTSATRKAVKPVVEAERSLLWYPVQYEGYEQSDAIVYTGAAPNQQIIPAIEWCLQDLLPSLPHVKAADPRIYLVGSDYVFPRCANAIIRRRLEDERLDVVGERYAPLGETDFEEVVRDITRATPHVIINTVNGSSNIGLFTTLDRYGINATRCPVISLSVAEGEIRDIGPQKLKGHFAVWNYFQSLPGDSNRQFITLFREQYGMGRVTSDPIATAYTQIRLFAEAARSAGVLTPEELRRQLTTVDIDTPIGRLRFDQQTGHFSKHVYIGQVNDQGQFEVIKHWNNGNLVPPQPVPFPELSEQFASALG